MPEFDAGTRTKITALRTLRATGVNVEVHELVKVNWPAPDGAIYYAITDLTQTASVAPSVSPIEVRLVPESVPDSFLPITVDATIGDEEVELPFWDADEVISQLMIDHGEGIKVEIYYWFPQVDLLLPEWLGHLQLEDEASVDILTLKAVQGFRSAESNVPNRAHWQECQRIFGGTLLDQTEIDAYGCDYNLHIGGAVGIDNPLTSLPWTYCDRADTASCTARGIDPLRHLSHKTIISTAINNQTSGSSLLSVSKGNETELTQSVRVVMGKRRVYDALLMAYRRDLNNNTPAHGWFQGLYEMCEGPIKSIEQAIITVENTPQTAVALHYSYRLGKDVQSAADLNLTTHGYSGTAYIRYAYGYVDPREVEPTEAKADAVIEGLTDIYTEESVAAGVGGLMGTYYSDVAFTDVVAVRLDENIDFGAVQAPFPAQGDDQWSVKWTGEIKPEFTETYTFRLHHDDGAKLIVNGVTVINNLAGVGDDTGTIALTANTLYDIEVQFKQGVSVWYCRLYWSCPVGIPTSVPVPSTRLYHDAFDGYGYTYTTNRAWHIARILTDKRWGFGLDIARLDMTSFAAAAAWCEQTVRYTDPFDVDWDHVRAESNVELIENKVQQQIEDMCVAGRLSKPFWFDGKIHIVPLSALTAPELAACPEFTDEGTTGRNIVWEGDPGDEKTTLRVSRQSSFALTNRVECTYSYISNNYLETPLQPVEDTDAQLAAGRVIGDGQRKVISKKYPLLGVVYKPQGYKLAWSILDLGPCDEGGLANNLRLKFKVWFADALDLHMDKVIKVTSSRLTKYGFTYFRIKKLSRQSDLQYEVEAQAYNETYMDAFELDIAPIVTIHPPPIDPPPCVLSFGTVSYVDGAMLIPIEPC